MAESGEQSAKPIAESGDPTADAAAAPEKPIAAKPDELERPPSAGDAATSPAAASPVKVETAAAILPADNSSPRCSASRGLGNATRASACWRDARR